MQIKQNLLDGSKVHGLRININKNLISVIQELMLLGLTLKDTL